MTKIVRYYIDQPKALSISELKEGWMGLNRFENVGLSGLLLLHSLGKTQVFHERLCRWLIECSGRYFLNVVFDF